MIAINNFVYRMLYYYWTMEGEEVTLHLYISPDDLESGEYVNVKSWDEKVEEIAFKKEEISKLDRYVSVLGEEIKEEAKKIFENGYPLTIKAISFVKHPEIAEELILKHNQKEDGLEETTTQEDSIYDI